MFSLIRSWDLPQLGLTGIWSASLMLWANLSGGKRRGSIAARKLTPFADDNYYQKWHANHLYYSDQDSPVAPMIAFAFAIPKLIKAPELSYWCRGSISQQMSQ